MNSVWITGMGVISPLGAGLEAHRIALREASCGIRYIRQFPTERFPVRIAGEVCDPTLPHAAAGRASVLLERALQEAFADAGLSLSEPSPRRALSCALGKQTVRLETLAAALAAPETDLAQEPPRWPPTFVRDWEEREPARQLDHLAGYAGALGPAYCCYTACASGNDALGMGKRLIERGEADMVVAAAADCQVNPLSLLEFDLLDALAQGEPEHACRPFDRERTGFVVGEGAAVLVLEAAEHARRRRARARGRLTGYGSALDCFGLTKCHPQGRGAALAMAAALADARRRPEEIGYINAHGTGTILNDRAESAAITRVWGTAGSVPVSSTKSMTGHLIAAAAAVEAVLTLLALDEQFLPATLNYSTPDPECPLAVVAQPRAARFQAAMSNGFGFGGQNSALILEAPE